MKDSYYHDPRVAAEYDAEHVGRDVTTDDIPFYVDLAREAASSGHSVLELACGTGRVTIPIADAGARVTGLDASAAMLEVAGAKTAGRNNPRWLQADMTEFRLEERFGLVIIPFSSFLHLLTVSDQKACLRLAHEHLVPGGRLALNIFNPDIVMIASWLTGRRDALERLRRQASAIAGRETWATRRYSTSQQSLDETRIEEGLSDEGAVISRVYRNLRLRYVFRYEMEHLLALSGFEVEALYGWFDRRPFDDESRQMVWTARRTNRIT
jgi:SAM-dependent methyltransferase